MSATAQAVAASSKECGTVKWFNASRGFGFVTRDGMEDSDLFVHFSNVIMQDPKEYKELEEGDRVEFEVADGPKGLAARSVKRI